MNLAVDLRIEMWIWILRFFSCSQMVFFLIVSTEQFVYLVFVTLAMVSLIPTGCEHLLGFIPCTLTTLREFMPAFCFYTEWEKTYTTGCWRERHAASLNVAGILTRSWHLKAIHPLTALDFSWIFLQVCPF